MQSKYIQLYKKHKLAVFVSALVVLVTGFSVLFAVIINGIYENSAEKKTQDMLYDASIYFTDTIRSCEDTSQIRIAYLGGTIPALVLPDKGSDYEENDEIWLFTYDGYLKKAVSSPGKAVSIEEGEDVMPMKSSDFHISYPYLMNIRITTVNDDTLTINIYIDNSGGEGNE